MSINDVMRDMQAYYQRYDLNPDYVKVYRRLLGDVEPDVLAKAADYWMKHAQYKHRFPMAGDLLDLVKKMPEIDIQAGYDDNWYENYPDPGYPPPARTDEELVERYGSTLDTPLLVLAEVLVNGE